MVVVVVVEEGFCFDIGFLGDMARLLQYLHHVLGHPRKEFVSPSKLHALKNGGPTDCCTQQFSRGFWTLYGSKYAI